MDAAGAYPRRCHSPSGTGTCGPDSGLCARGRQRCGVVRDVVADEAGDEVVAVVVAGLHAQLQWMPRCVTRLAQQFGLQLPGEEFVRVALDDLQRLLLARALHQLDGVVLFPRLRSEEHTSDLQSLMRISYAVSCF